MTGNICFSVTKNCYAMNWSYGEICVHCNSCGRYGKGLKMWEARLDFHQQELEENKNFTLLADNPAVIEIQKQNIKENIKYHKEKISYCKNKIKKLKL